MRLPLRSLTIDSIETLVLRCLEFAEKNGGESPVLVLGLRNGAEKIGRPVGFGYGMVCFQTMEPVRGGFWETDGVFYVSILDVVTLGVPNIGNPEASRIFSKEQKSAEPVSRLAVGRTFVESVRNAVGSSEFPVEIDWATFGTGTPEGFSHFLSLLSEAIGEVLRDSLGKESWDQTVRSVKVRSSERTDIVQKDGVLEISFWTSPFASKTSANDVKSMIERVL